MIKDRHIEALLDALRAEERIRTATFVRGREIARAHVDLSDALENIIDECTTRCREVSVSLTKAQAKEIEQRVIEMVCEDIQQNPDYLRQVVETYVQNQSLEEQIDIAVGTNDIEAAREVFNFNPWTGDPWSEEEA